MKHIYLDNSATSWPKPESVKDAILDYLANYGASPGRSGHHLAQKAERMVFETRDLIADFFNAPESDRVVFASNATHAINIALKGILKKGDHVITSSMEHNSVMRPLRFLEETKGVEVTVLQNDHHGKFPLEDLKNNMKKNTKLVLTIHGSNVIGTLNPINEIGEICRQNNVLFMVDAAQSAGYFPIDVQRDHIDLLAFTGHKKLYGPPGIGGLVIRDEIDMEIFLHGGTGSISEMEAHPKFYPDKLEAGTKNSVGIVGLKAGMEYVLKNGMDNIRNQVTELSTFFVDELLKIEEIKFYGPSDQTGKLPVISINIKNHISSDVAHFLDKEYGIMTRVGLHCSPAAHKTIGTFPDGTLRFGLGSFNKPDDIVVTIAALKKLIAGK